MKKGKQEVEYKEKAGTAWSHSYLNQKPWHPLSYPNQRRKWIAEQTHAQKEDRKAEVAREFAQEQDFFRQTAQMSKKEKEKMEARQAVSFMYIRPPGYNAEEARAAEIADEEKSLGLKTAGASNPADTNAVDPTDVGNERAEGAKKPRAKDVFGRTLPTGEEFPVLKNAPRHDTGAPTRVKPFAVEIRNVKCARCGAFGHQSGDRECALKDMIMPNEEARLIREDPLSVILAQTASDEPLTWELKQKAGGLSPARGGFKAEDPNQQIIPDEDIYDEYGGFLPGGGDEGGVSIPNLLASIIHEQRKELTAADSGKPRKRKKGKEKRKRKHSSRREAAYSDGAADQEKHRYDDERTSSDSTSDGHRHSRPRAKRKANVQEKEDWTRQVDGHKRESGGEEQSRHGFKGRRRAHRSEVRKKKRVSGSRRSPRSKDEPRIARSTNADRFDSSLHDRERYRDQDRRRQSEEDERKRNSGSYEEGFGRRRVEDWKGHADGDKRESDRSYDDQKRKHESKRGSSSRQSSGGDDKRRRHRSKGKGNGQSDDEKRSQKRHNIHKLPSIEDDLKVTRVEITDRTHISLHDRGRLKHEQRRRDTEEEEKIRLGCRDRRSNSSSSEERSGRQRYDCLKRYADGGGRKSSRRYDDEKKRSRRVALGENDQSR